MVERLKKANEAFELVSKLVKMIGWPNGKSKIFVGRRVYILCQRCLVRDWKESSDLSDNG